MFEGLDAHDASPPFLRSYDFVPNVRTGYDEGAKFYSFDRSSARILVNFLIDNASLIVGDEILRQVKGIPMGVSPAMFFANDYLLAHEYNLNLRDAIQAYTSATSSQQRMAIKTALPTFQVVARYADDEVIFNRPFAIPRVAVLC